MQRTRRSVRAAVMASVAVLVTGLLVAPGCESMPKGEPYAENTPAKTLSRIYLYRAITPKEPREIAAKVGQADLGVLRPGEYVSVLVTPGEHIVGVSEDKMGSAVRSVDLLPGESAWLEVGFREFSEALWIFRPEVPTARERIARSRLAENRTEPANQPLPPAKTVEELMREAANGG